MHIVFSYFIEITNSLLCFTVYIRLPCTMLHSWWNQWSFTLQLHKTYPEQIYPLGFHYFRRASVSDCCVALEFGGFVVPCWGVYASCSRSANKPSTSCVRTSCSKLSTSLDNLVTTLLILSDLLQGCSNKSDTWSWYNSIVIQPYQQLA
jgi:hypothetical protein